MISVADWVNFLKSFTYPNHEKGELWKVSTQPLMVLHLNFNRKDEKKKDKSKKKKEETTT